MIITYYYRYSGDVLFCRTDIYTEIVTADFSLPLNGNAYWYPGAVVTQKTINTITFTSPFIADCGYSATYIKGLGITNMEENGFVYYHYRLIKAEIK